MAKHFEWMDSYSVGVTSLDDEHETLIGHLDRVIAAISDHGAIETIRAALDDLIEFTLTHFEHEEALMEKTGYPRFEHHRSSHDRMIRHFSKCALSYIRGTLNSADFGFFLRDWVLKHVLDEDMQYAQHFQDKGVR